MSRKRISPEVGERFRLERIWDQIIAGRDASMLDDIRQAED